MRLGSVCQNEPSKLANILMLIAYSDVLKKKANLPCVSTKRRIGREVTATSETIKTIQTQGKANSLIHFRQFVRRKRGNQSS